MILIVSPHLDDGVLGCGDHAFGWCAGGHAVTVLTVFTAASACVSPLLSAADAAALDGQAYMARRRAEDQAALLRLGLRGAHLGLVDAGFRGGSAPHFPDLRSLLCGTVGIGGDAQVAQAVHALRLRGDQPTLVLCPLAVGGHVDHVITRLACEATFAAERLAYYADMPYARAPWRWRRAQVQAAWQSIRSWRRISPRKRDSLAAYGSQMPLLFRGTPRLPELLLFRSSAQMPRVRER